MIQKFGVAVVVAAIAGIFSLASMGLSVWGSIRTTDLQTELTSFEEGLARRGAFLERQLELYFEAAAITSKIATSGEGIDKEVAIRRFRELYWGELAVVEDAEVQDAMVEFGRILDKSAKSDCLRDQQIAQAATEPTESVIKVCLLLGALDLAHAARTSLEKSWNVGLVDLTPIREPSAD